MEGGGSRDAPAQKKDVPSVCRGKMIDLAIAVLLKGLPTRLCAYRSIASSDRFEHPSCKYEYRGLRPVREASSTPTASLNIRQTFVIWPPAPALSPIASSTCVNGESWQAAARRFNAGSCQTLAESIL